MKKYRVNVNGTVYEVELEEITGTTAPIEAPAVAPAPAAPVSSAPAGGEQITSPMPGNILSVNISAGDTVKKGQVIGIVEAMKLMNEIESEYDGIVEEILVKNEETVEYGQPLFRIR